MFADRTAKASMYSDGASSIDDASELSGSKLCHPCGAAELDP